MMVGAKSGNAGAEVGNHDVERTSSPGWHGIGYGPVKPGVVGIEFFMRLVADGHNDRRKLADFAELTRASPAKVQSEALGGSDCPRVDSVGGVGASGLSGRANHRSPQRSGELTPGGVTCAYEKGLA